MFSKSALVKAFGFAAVMPIAQGCWNQCSLPDNPADANDCSGIINSSCRNQINVAGSNLANGPIVTPETDDQINLS